MSAGPISAIEFSEPRTRNYDPVLKRKNPKKVLIVNTGGTIFMESKKSGVMGIHSDVLAKTIDSLTEMDDPYMPEVSFCSIKPLIDSSNMTPEHWIAIHSTIRKYQNDYDGFVVTHGTDTMSFTATALSFLAHDLKKPLFFTGAQIPLFKPYNDGRQNLLSAIFLAGFKNKVIPETAILFCGKLFRANRSTKSSSSTMDAFESPNFSALATLGTWRSVEWARIRLKPQAQLLMSQLVPNFSRNIHIISVTPTLTTKQLLKQLHFFADENVDSGTGTDAARNKDGLSSRPTNSSDGFDGTAITKVEKGDSNIASDTGGDINLTSALTNTAKDASRSVQPGSNELNGSLNQPEEGANQDIPPNMSVPVKSDPAEGDQDHQSDDGDDLIFRHPGPDDDEDDDTVPVLCPEVPVMNLGEREKVAQQGIILRAFGTGNIPLNNTEVLDAIEQLIKGGTVVLIASHCLRGRVDLRSYEGGAQLKKIGCIGTHDMTIEAAEVKLSLLLGQECFTVKEINDWMGKSFQGEISGPLQGRQDDAK